MNSCEEFEKQLTISRQKWTPAVDKRETARTDLLAFTRHTRPKYRVNWHHKTLAAMLDRVAAGEYRRLMVFMPPQHGKSELVSRRFPAYMLGRDPDLRLIAASHTHELAVAMNRDVQRVLDHERYRKLFPHTKLTTPRSPRGLFLPRRTMGFFEIAGKRGSLRSAGVGQSIAGLPADGAIIDDPFGKREDADSAAIRQKVWDWYANDLYSRLSTDAWIVLTHTRWHRDDPAGRLLQKMADRAADQWEVLCLPAIRGDVGWTSESVQSVPDGLGGPSYSHPHDPRQPGAALWPEFKSLEDLELIRQQDARAFAALYQQDPAEATLADWPPELFGPEIWCPREKWPSEFSLGVVCLDASKGGGDRPGDYTAIVFIGVHSNGLIYVDAIIERIPLTQIARRTLAFCDQYRPHFVGIEAEQFQELLVHEFHRQCQGFTTRWSVWEMSSQGINKVARIRRLTRYISAREFRFKADSPGCRRLVDQLMDFPLAEHDDGPDALEMCVRLPVAVKRMR